MEVGSTVGGAFLSSALNVFFDQMSHKFPSLFRERKHDEQLLWKLQRTLLVIEAVLDDAEDKQIADKHVEEWVFKVKDTVYHAEDLVDEINIEALHVEAGVSHLSDEFLKGIIPKMEEIVTILEELVSEINLLGLERGVFEKHDSHRLPLIVDDSDVYGRDNDKEDLIEMVLSDGPNENTVSVIYVVGMGGVGKTTLAQVVYGDERVKKHFDTRAWVCASEYYDVVKLTEALLREVTRSDHLNMLQVKLKESLGLKKFLIVLNDFWNDNYADWNKFIDLLKHGKQGSKIIVMTRNEELAFTNGNGPIYHLKPMSDEDCWYLFQKYAFDNGGSLASLEFKIIGKEIVKKCKGSPLAVKMLVGLLQSKTKVKEWVGILTSEFWTLKNESDDVLPVLRLSYHHLPPHLKHCLAFCAIFPKNYHFKEEDLVLLWMANDLLQHLTGNDKRIEDLGHECFSELRSRFFFQKVSNGKYSMHGLVNDLARYACEKFCVRSEDYRHGEIPSEARHFSYMPENYDAFEKFKFLTQVKNLRTFLPVNPGRYRQHKLTKMFLSHVLPGLGRLRVLSLCYYNIKELPSSVCNLKQLRYVNLSSTGIKQLPHAICSLRNLQTLLLSHCVYLDQLPMDLTNLFNLRHLDLRGTELTEMPSYMSRLKSLQTLSCFIVSKSPGRNIGELRNLQLHGYLKIMGLQNVMSRNDALEVNLRNKNLLEELVLQWSGNTNDSHISRGIFDLLQPHINLKSLTIDGYGGTTFPNWLADDSFCKIVSLCLTNCLKCFSLPTLGHLASLKSLTINGLHGITKMGQEFYGDVSFTKPFQSLVTLRIEQMFEWEEWDTSGNVDFSRLEELYIIDCPKLTGELPSQLSCIREFVISGCPQLVLRSQLSSLQLLRISDMPDLKELPEGLLRLGLEELRVQRCDNLLSSRKVMTQVNKIILKDCPSLVSLPIMVPSASIKELIVANCTRFKFPIGQKSEVCYLALERLRVENAGDSFNDISLGLFPKLLTLSIHGCMSLKVFPVHCRIRNLTLLHRLEFWNCDNLLSFPEGGLPAPNLEVLWVYSCKKLKSLPVQMLSLLPSLRVLYVVGCPEVESFPEGGFPSSLESLCITSCQKLITCKRHWGLQRLPALREFIIGDDYEESFPDKWLLPCSLRVLRIGHHKNLKTLNQMGLLPLTSLETLDISCSPKLLSLPEEGLPTSLSELYVWDCPLLKPHLERERGKYWPKIAHISNIVVDGELIS